MGFGVEVKDQQIADWMKNSKSAVNAANKKGVRAALAVWKRTAQAMGAAVAGAGPAAAILGSPRGYKTYVDQVSDGVVRGSLGAVYPGSIIETGSKAHWLLMRPDVVDWALRHGRPDLVRPAVARVSGGGHSWWVSLAGNPLLVTWLVAHNRLNADGTAKFLKVHAQAGHPIVIPAAQATETEASDAWGESMYVSF